MARRKQKRPSQNISKRVKFDVGSSSSREADAIVTSDVNGAHNDHGTIVYSPIAAFDYVIEIAEVGLQAVVYEHPMLPDEFKRQLSDENALGVRLCLPTVERDFILSWHTFSHEDVRVQVFQKQDNRDQCMNSDMKVDDIWRVLASGYLDGPRDSISGTAYLFKAGFVSMKPYIEDDSRNDMDSNVISVRLRIGITRKAFDSSNGILDSGKSLWSRSMLKMMKWLRPELHTDEAIYGISTSRRSSENSSQMSTGSLSSPENISQQEFDSSALYEAIKPDQNGPVLATNPRQLRAKLRPYQSRAAYWMICREKLDGSRLANVEMKWPFCSEVVSADKKSVFYYNPFSGIVSWTRFEGIPDIRGGILADEMGLGKTIELLACIMSNPYKSLTSDLDQTAEEAANKLDEELKTRKQERIDCPCGAYDKEVNDRIWVQCNCCDVWQHASCVGFGPEFEYVRNFEREISSKGKRSKSCTIIKKPKRAAGRITATMEIRHSVNKDYICGSCSRLIGSVEVPGISGATLIVCPPSILQQWQEEIARHTEKGALKLIVYEGFQRGGGLHSGDEVKSSKYGQVVGAHELASADIVLTTYTTLQADLSHDTDGDDASQRSMRYTKRYPVVPTSLTRMKWWRVCLDEAQMVESSSARATEMAKRLNAEIRWCITGTPIQRSLDDLHGLLRFLDLQPFNNLLWWNRIIKEPYEKNVLGAVSFTHKYLKHFVWRTSKIHILDELGLPPQEELLTWLQFSPIEAHFYRRQHERCSNKVMEAMTGSIGEEDRVLSYTEIAKVLHPLLSLRQACCHPQVGSSGLRSLQKTPMTMDEVLKVLLEKAKVEGEEAQRNLIGALNGLAALLILEQDHASAVKTYREALSLMEENFEEFDVDPLQKLHVLHNLNEVLETLRNSSAVDEGQPTKSDTVEGDLVATPPVKKQRADNMHDISGNIHIPRTLRDELLQQQSREISSKYMSSFDAKLTAARSDYKNAHNQVCKMMEELKDNQGTTWWLGALDSLSTSSKQADEFVKKLKDSLLEIDYLALSRTGHENASSLALRFNDINGLRYILNREIDAIFHHREKLISMISEIDLMMDNPTAEAIARAGNCLNCKKQKNGSLCIHCEMDKIYQMYENRLFLLKSSAGNIGDVVSIEDAYNLQEYKNRKASNSLEEDGKRKASYTTNIQVTRYPSETEVILKYIKSNMKRKMGPELIAASVKHLELLEEMRKEYAQARALALSQRMVLLALDELNMAKTRLCLRFPGEEISTEIEQIFKVYLEEIPQKNAELTGEKFVSLDNLRRAKGQLRYLKGLAMTRERQKEIVHENGSALQISGSDVHVPGKFENISEKKSRFTNNEDESCPVCQETLGIQFMILPCGHMLCCRCLLMIAENDTLPLPGRGTKTILCPTCRFSTYMENIAVIDNGGCSTSYSLTMTKLQNKEIESGSSISIKGSYGTKMDAVVKRILEVQETDGSSRFLVFSTWNDVLDVVEHSLTANKINFIRAKGRRKLNEAIKKFKEDDTSARILLLLIQQGANGLNLTEAQHVILIEPLLNLGAEAQAINRVHRIGQSRATYVHRFLIKDTVEESIYNLSRVKSQPASSVSVKKNHDISALTVKDLKTLFKRNNSEYQQPNQSNSIVEQISNHPMLNLRELPPAVAAATAAEARLKISTE